MATSFGVSDGGNGSANSLEQFKKYTTDKIRDLYCPRHQKQPQVVFNGVSLKEVKVSMTGCCETLMELANKAIGQR